MAPYLYHAARNGAWRTVGDVPEVLRHERNRKQAEYVASDGKTALHWVCSFEDFPLKIVRALLDAFPDAALIQDVCGHVPLHIAYMGASDDVIEELRNACPQASFIRNNWGWTPDMMRALMGADITCSSVMSDNLHPPSYHFFKEWNDVVITKIPLLDTTNPVSSLLVDKLKEAYDKAKLLLQTEVTRGSPNDMPFRMVHASLGVACCSWSFFHLAMKLHPDQALQVDEMGRLPLHLAAASSSLCDGEFYKCVSCLKTPIYGTRYHYKLDHMQVCCHACLVKNDLNVMNYHQCGTCEKGPAAIKELLTLYPSTAKVPTSNGRLALNIALENSKHWDSGIKSLFQIAPESLTVRDSGTHMFPFMVGAMENLPRGNSRWGNLKSSNEEYLGKFTTIYNLLMEAPYLVRYGIPQDENFDER